MQNLRFAHRDWTFTVDPRNLVFVDETGMHLGFTRRCGRAPQGERLYDTQPGNCGQNISLIGGMSIDGLIATMSIAGSVNTDVFLFYIEQILIPIVLDRCNCSDGQSASASCSGDSGGD